MAIKTDLIHVISADPGVNEDSSNGYFIGDDLKNDISGELFMCLDDTPGAAVWKSLNNILQGVIDGPTSLGVDSILTPPALVADTNDYDPVGFRVSNKIVKSYLNMTVAGANRRLTGMVPSSPVENSIVYIHNEGPNNIIIRNNDVASVATNRFDVRNNRTIQTKETIGFVYNSVTLRWNLLAGQI